MKGYRKWTEAEIEYLRQIYPDHSNEYCAQFLHRSKRSCQHKAFELGISKTPEFAKQQFTANQFKKGHVPFNKGKKWEHYMSEEGQRKASETFFGGKPHNTPPPGYEVLRAAHRGKRYWWIKPADGRRMMPKHRWLWEQAYGSIPKGYNVQFKDGDTTNCVLDNLYLITRDKQMKAAMWKKITKSRNESIKRDKLRMKWGMPQKTKLRLKPT